MRLFLVLFIWALHLEAQELPQSFSLRPNFDQWMPVIRNQGHRLACDAFTIASIVEYECHAQGDIAVLSPEFLEWATGEWSHDLRDRKGYATMIMVKALNKYGICTEAMMPYDHVKWPNNEVLTNARSRATGVVTWLTKTCEYSAIGKGFTQQEIDSICSTVSHGHPVLVDMQWPSKPVFTNKVLHLSASPNTRYGHTMAAVGYDRVAGVIVFRNSWGSGWGDRGYIGVTFEYLRAKGAQALTIEFP